jgi:hypothetical protein
MVDRITREDAILQTVKEIAVAELMYPLILTWWPTNEKNRDACAVFPERIENCVLMFESCYF